MAKTAAEAINEFPVPAYRFVVTIGGEAFRFQNVTIGEFGHEPITYRDGLGVVHMPGRKIDQVAVTLTRGIVSQASSLYDWLQSINFNRVEKKDIVVSLTDDSGQEPILTWKVFNVFPTSMSVPNFSADSNEIAVETVNLTADQVTVEY